MASKSHVDGRRDLNSVGHRAGQHPGHGAALSAGAWAFAAAKMVQDGAVDTPGQTLQATALVHEAAETSLSTKSTGVPRKLVVPTSSRCFVFRHGNLGRRTLYLRAGNGLQRLSPAKERFSGQRGRHKLRHGRAGPFVSMTSLASLCVRFWSRSTLVSPNAVAGDAHGRLSRLSDWTEMTPMNVLEFLPA